MNTDCCLDQNRTEVARVLKGENFSHTKCGLFTDPKFSTYGKIKHSL
jgi:hypothetical protein